MKLLKLNTLTKKISKAEMSEIQAGQNMKLVVCRCACAWVGQGGSSSSDNGGANGAGGLSSPGM